MVKAKVSRADAERWIKYYAVIDERDARRAKLKTTARKPKSKAAAKPTKKKQLETTAHDQILGMMYVGLGVSTILAIARILGVIL